MSMSCLYIGITVIFYLNMNRCRNEAEEKIFNSGNYEDT